MDTVCHLIASIHDFKSKQVFNAYTVCHSIASIHDFKSKQVFNAYSLPFDRIIYQINN